MSLSFDKFSKRAKLPRASKPVINKITSMIQNGDLKPGDRLPPQDVLADHLGVSRTTLREALKELSFRGLIVCKHGIGTFVSSGLVSDLEVVEARKYVEKGTSYHAARLANTSNAKKLLKLVNTMEKYVVTHEIEEFSLKDFEFHNLIAKLSENRVFQKIMQTFSDLLLTQQILVQRLPGAIERAHSYHRLIAEAIINKNPEMASKNMEEHLEDVHKALLKYYQGGGS
ncbi:MAG: FadR family transcriptional regulator [Candidatus Atribacteria bacterium]|nr:FadR family transcriptional regulator [Candidatus Atribacteria bacterium]